MSEIKHGGCYDCGSKAQEILTARTVPEVSSGMTVALCQDCERKRGIR